MQNKNDNFFDSRTLLAIVLVGAVFFGWQSYLSKKYPQSAVKKDEVTSNNAESKKDGQINQQSPQTAAAGSAKSELTTSPQVANAEATKETIESYKTENFIGSVSSHGMGIRQVELTKFLNREKSPVKLANHDELGAFSLVNLDSSTPVNFAVKKLGELSFEGEANVSGAKIVRKIEINPSNYSFKNNIKVLVSSGDFKGFSLFVGEQRLPEAKSSFLMPRFDHQQFLVSTPAKTDRFNIESSKEITPDQFSGLQVFGLSSQYFTTSFFDQSQITPDLKLLAQVNSKSVGGLVSYRPSSPSGELNFEFTTYIGPKSFGILQSVDNKLTELIDYGMFSAIAKVLLKIMQWFNQGVMNWGVSIILLTLLVRVVVLPFNLASYKSMKKMQKIQPMMQSLREKYKDDAQTLNREMMVLMKDQKVNPLGGCLPMLLQMPIFFALYQVFGQSIELYQAPFMLWIQDLSLKDPFYVLPVLMGIAMFFQQKLTPTTMDPAQAKILQWMPLVFSFMMISLPSGLTLYIFVTTLFGVIQQQLFMRDKTASVAIREAKA